MTNSVIPLIGRMVDMHCESCGAQDWKVGTAKTASGSTVHPYYCGQCLTHTTQYLKKAQSAKIDCSHIITFDERREKRFCEVCGIEGAEYHHWAPYHLFGDDSGSWPGSYLCVQHHLLWHRTVTPNMCKVTNP